MTEQKNRLDLKSLTLDKLQNRLMELGEKAFRAKQIYQWIHEKLAAGYEDMSNLSKDLREKLQKEEELIKLNINYLKMIIIKSIMVKKL